MDTPLILMDTQRVHRSAKRMGYEIVEQNSSNKPIILFGIDQRGYAVAQLLAEILSEIFEGPVRTVPLAVKGVGPEEEFANLAEQEIENSLPIIVDDVIFSGQTMFQALKKVSAKADPSEMHTAVMIDRGHRKLPIKAEFYGMELPTKHNERVSVKVENMNVKAVELEKI